MLGWEPDQKHPNRCQGLAQLQTLTLAARVSAVEPGPASANMLTQQTLQGSTQALVAKLEPKQDVDHHSCSPGPGEAEDAHAGWEPDQKHPNRCPGPGTAADTHASSLSVCS